MFPFGHNAEEVMLHGRSNNVSKEGEASTFTWAARMHFRRSDDGSVLIDKYTIIVVSPLDISTDQFMAQAGEECSDILCRTLTHPPSELLGK